MVLIELVEQGEAVQRSEADEDGGARRRRFGRGRSAQEAPEGSNRAARRAALRGRGAATAEPEAAEAEAEDGVREDDELAPNVPTDAEIEAGATPLEAAEEDEADEDQDEADDEAVAEGDVDADAEADEAEDGDDEAEGKRKR
jgi:hypothetical protein